MSTDLILDGEKVNWYSYWGAFYWVSKGYLVIKVDMSFSTSDADIEDPINDPCSLTKPIFGCTGFSDANCIKHVTPILFTSTGGVPSDMLDHVWVYKMMYIVVRGTGNFPRTIFKVKGNPRATGSMGTLNIS